LTKAMILAVDLSLYDRDDSIEEITALRQAADIDVEFSAVQKRQAPHPKYYIGKGILAQAKEKADIFGVTLCIFDCELAGSQIKNLTDFLNMEVIDRTMLILNIFSRRATTAEGKLQTELATLKYRLPRLSGMGSDLSRQGGGGRGGGGARRGAGESKLEYDRRYIQNRIDHIQEKLKKIENHRNLLSGARKKNEVPIVALAGYTNVGKSSLVNALTGSDIFQKDMLFATLDPTARSLTLPSGQNVIMIDTVGFVSRLPHNLVEAFKSTLANIKYADVILLVCDASSPHCQRQIEVTEGVLAQIGRETQNIIVVRNKRDKTGDIFHFSQGLYTSAKTGEGLPRLLAAIDEKLKENMINLSLTIPYDKTKLLSVIRENGRIDSEEYRTTGIKITGAVNKKFAHLFK
jgi:GTP-binding protein HflX